MNKKSLVIVESPTKARTISKFLGGNFIVSSSMGHVRDLPKSKLGVDTEHGFEPKYVVPAAAKAVIADLKAKAKNSKEVILATDEDREGEAIAWHLAQALKLNDKKIKRIVFHEITKNAIIQALNSPRGLNKNLIDAQQARRVLDRLVGYKLSPFLWKKVMRGLSAGRVQSAAMRLIVEREEEIKKFQPREYWNIVATLEPSSDDKTAFFARLAGVDGKPMKKFDIATAEQANGLLKNLEGADYKVETVETKEVKRHPAAPFTTSTLQQDCAHKFGYTARQTMMIAQQLYEGIELGEEGSIGLISYMRTDSVNLAEETLAQIRALILRQFGEKYSLQEPRRYKTKSKNAQEAHEAIRPTDVWRDPDSLKKYLDAKQFKVYSLIWKRAVACQMPEAIFDQTIAEISATNHKPQTTNYTFRAAGQVLKFDGFTRLYEIPQENGDKKDDDEPIEGVLPELKEKQKLKLLDLASKQSFTEPPPRFTDASLIKTLEEAGIGRPSTYAPIISTILARKYVERIERKFFPTEIGGVVNNILVENFPQIVDLEFTANMENGLDEIAEGERAWQPMIAEFYEPFEKNLAEKIETVEKRVEVTDQPCPKCGKMMIVKYGRFGKFLACPDYPECKTTQALPEEKKQEDELAEKYKDEKCPICGKPMNVRRGRYGYFLGCPDYPKCKGIKKIEKTTGQKCPKCGQGEVVQKKSKRGAFFYACNRYPECDYTANKLAEAEPAVPAAK